MKRFRDEELTLNSKAASIIDDGDYLTWPEDVRYELIDGKAYLTPLLLTLEHPDIAGEIYRQRANQLEGKPCRVRPPKEDGADELIDTVVQPDVLVVCDESKPDRRAVRGAPDLVVEAVSPASAFYDHQRKRAVGGARTGWWIPSNA